MTDYELFSLAAKYQEVALVCTGIFISVVSGFLVMSYAIGPQLTRRQVWLVAPVFLVFSTVALYTAIAFSALSNRFYPVAYRNPDKAPFSIITPSDPFNLVHLSLVMGGVIILSSLMFLRGIRVRAAEEAQEPATIDRATDDLMPQEPADSHASNAVGIAPSDELSSEASEATNTVANNERQTSS